MLSTNTGLSLTQAATDTLAHSITDASALAAALGKATPLKTTFPTTSIGAQLQQVAQIIQVQSYLGMRRQIFFCSLGGFDTHAAELQAHTTLRPQLSPALAAFYAATQELAMAQNVTTFTESDFSRTFQPTTEDGSDHAWGSHHLVLGGAVKGGQIFGQFPQFESRAAPTTPTREAAGSPPPRSINTEPHCATGSASQPARRQQFSRTWQTSRPQTSDS